MKRTTRPPKQQTVASPEYLPTEHQIAASFVQYVELNHPTVADSLLHIPNENKCSWAQGKKLKAEGKKAGVSDYFFAKPVVMRLEGKIIGEEQSYQDYLICGLWLELQSKKGKESNEQKAFGERMKANGFAYKCVHSLDKAIEIFETYLKGKPFD